jgi:uncharacterized protein YprB with RNaseH-like and TPR domain
MESFSDKLKSLGVHQGLKDFSPKKPTIGTYPIENVISGFESESTFGQTFIFERHTNAEDTQGQIHFNMRPDLSILAAWRNHPELVSIPINRILYLDTETSGLAGGTGTFAFMVGIGYIDDQGFHDFQLFLRHPAEERALLASLTKFIEGFEVVVTFNGASFDIPLLNTRHTMNSIQSPFPERLHIDMLPLARRLWKNRLPSRRLGNLEVEILGMGRTEDEVPGWLVPELYHDYILSGDHNEMDIRSLAALFLHCADLLTNPMNYATDEGLDLIAIGRLFEELGHTDKALELYDSALNAGLPEDFYIQTILRYAEIYRKRGDFQAASVLWVKAADLGNVDACINLSKHYEHHEKEIHQAYHWADQARRLILANNSTTSFSAEYILSPVENRLSRLKKKLEA